jgi:hypothetical protein
MNRGGVTVNKQPELPDFIRDLEIQQSLHAFNQATRLDEETDVDESDGDGEVSEPLPS